ncbi:Modular serine protease, partial [Gryllus bimaculatus]
MRLEAPLKYLVAIAFVGWNTSLCYFLPNSTSLERWKRESCGENMFKCKSGECVSAALVCNGERNCEDRSDETSETCINNVIPILASYLNPPLTSYIDQCPPQLFRCDNGNCIPHDKKCNSFRDCSDGSDEKDCKIELCRSEEFKCKDGLCISSKNVCNGIKECTDGSDETVEQCQSQRCESNHFKCEYGACIPKASACDGTVHCVDGSDENPAMCHKPTSSPTPPRVTTGCVLPSQPVNGIYHVGGCEPQSCNVSPGSTISNFAILNFTCIPGFHLSGLNIIWCSNEMWSSPFPTCSRALCPPLKNPSRYFECTESGTIVNCSEPMVPGTKATVRCENFHTAGPELSSYDIICKETGQWSNVVYSCTPECGLPNPGGLPFIANGRVAKLAEFPWHVGIFKMMGDTFKQICGGNLVTAKMIISAAHCFWLESERRVDSIQNYRIAAGKYYLQWDKRTDYFQESKIENIYVHRSFRGRAGLYDADIAVVALTNNFVINEAVRPICLDFDRRYSEDFKAGKVGVIVGWGYTENQTQSEELHAITLPYEDRNVCIERTKESLIPYLIAHDKFCVGTNSGKSVCPGDSGGGFALKFGNGIQYYLMGVVTDCLPRNSSVGYPIT